LPSSRSPRRAPGNPVRHRRRHTTNLIEHPELIAERIVRFARIVGRDNVIAGADCGFAASGIRFNDTHPSVAWLKFAALAGGARLATRQLWGGRKEYREWEVRRTYRAVFSRSGARSAGRRARHDSLLHRGAQ